jgi:hypothetical protein
VLSMAIGSHVPRSLSLLFVRCSFLNFILCRNVMSSKKSDYFEKFRSQEKNGSNVKLVDCYLLYCR